ncbi:MAG: hypothetical protein AB8U25_03830 [Rickettsiales endosymbiont of Dermacentor nuttalli]
MVTKEGAYTMSFVSSSNNYSGSININEGIL